VWLHLLRGGEVLVAQRVGVELLGDGGQAAQDAVLALDAVKGQGVPGSCSEPPSLSRRLPDHYANVERARTEKSVLRQRLRRGYNPLLPFVLAG
jgi:hypothetical protein